MNQSTLLKKLKYEELIRKTDFSSVDLFVPTTDLNRLVHVDELTALL